MNNVLAHAFLSASESPISFGNFYSERTPKRMQSGYEGVRYAALIPVYCEGDLKAPDEKVFKDVFDKFKTPSFDQHEEALGVIWS